MCQAFTFAERFDDTWTKDKVDGSWKMLERSITFFVSDLNEIMAKNPKELKEFNILSTWSLKGEWQRSRSRISID